MKTKKDLKIHDDIINQSLDFLKLGNRSQRKIINLLKGQKGEIIEQLKIIELSKAKKKDLNKTLKQINIIINNYYNKIKETTKKELEGIGETVGLMTKKSLDSAFEGFIESQLPSVKVLNELSEGSYIQGGLLKDWWNNQEADEIFKVKRVINSGIINGFSNTLIVREVSKQLQISANNAGGIVHTAVQTIANEARFKTFEENLDIISEYEWIATLDGHTCVKCIPLDGKRWEAETKKPIGHSITFLKPPIHFKDRCVLVPGTKLFKELGIERTEGQRPSAIGVVSSNVRFEEFLKRSGEDFQDESLGKGRAELWRKGKITLTDLINNQGNELTLKQIKDKI